MERSKDHEVRIHDAYRKARELNKGVRRDESMALAKLPSATRRYGPGLKALESFTFSEPHMPAYEDFDECDELNLPNIPHFSPTALCTTLLAQAFRSFCVLDYRYRRCLYQVGLWNNCETIENQSISCR